MTTKTPCPGEYIDGVPCHCPGCPLHNCRGEGCGPNDHPGCGGGAEPRLSAEEQTFVREARGYLRSGFYDMDIGGTRGGNLNARATERDYLEKALDLLDRLTGKGA
jgi:hypothetical protein